MDTPERGGKVCQACGELTAWEGRREYDAQHVHGGDCIGFRRGHESCRIYYDVRRRPTRACEVCRAVIEATPERRYGLSWVCGDCERSLRAEGVFVAGTLRELEAERYADGLVNRGPPTGPAFPEDPESHDHRPVPPPEGWLPAGLRICEVCGDPRGEAAGPEEDGSVGDWHSSCWCEGLPCRSCGRPGGIRRPTTNHYGAEDGIWWHTPYFMGMQQDCRFCRG